MTGIPAKKEITRAACSYTPKETKNMRERTTIGGGSARVGTNPEFGYSVVKELIPEVEH